ncbi:hypothetical protein [Sphingopyxis sp. PET50]|nr:hypothetical protein [Sphingopyxis sp. PET50]
MIVGGTPGLIAACAFGIWNRFDLMDDLAAAEAEIDRLRGA